VDDALSYRIIQPIHLIRLLFLHGKLIDLDLKGLAELGFKLQMMKVWLRFPIVLLPMCKGRQEMMPIPLESMRVMARVNSRWREGN
jgi:hypothetical protein